MIKRENELIEVQFENDSKNKNRMLWWYSSDLALFETESKKEEWRSEVKVADLVDAQDAMKIWYASTVVDKKANKDEGYPEVKIGYRTYHPEGNREDNNREKYFGWSESFDNWLPLYSPRI